MLVAIEFILVLIIIALAFIDNKKIPTAYVVKQNQLEETNFKVFTKAVCEEKSEHIICHDELFAKCNDREYLLSNYSSEGFVECNNIRLNLSNVDVNGNAKFKKEWLDPRKKVK